MSDIFIRIFNIGITAGWFVLAILLCRPFMKRVPKWVSCLLWAVVGLRLCLPIELESIFSLVPSAEPLPADIMTATSPAINSGVSALNNVVNPIISDSLAPAPAASVNPMQVLIEVAAYIWVGGIILLLGYGAVSYVLLRRRVRVSLRGEGNLYFCDDVDSPFILGVILPRIYLPSSMSGEALRHVLAHERAHLRRLDHLWKPLGFILLALYWFNPLTWVAYALLCRDIEAACDERVIKEMTDDAKKDYSRTLLNCSMHRRRIMACPLAFGEVGVKARVKSILNYKKPAFWVIIAALVVTVVLSVCFLTNPRSDVRELLEPGSEWLCEDGARISVIVDNSQRMSGMLTFGGNLDDVVIRYRAEGRKFYAEVFKSEVDNLDYDINDDGLVSPDEYSDASAEQLIISGVLKVRGDDIVMKIEKDGLGIEEKKLVFKKTKDSGNRVVRLSDDEESYYVKITDCGSDKRGADVSFVQAKREGDDVVFTLKWKNRTFKTQIYGESFEVYRYEGDELIPLDFIGYWKEVATGVGAFSMAYPSFNITDHYDISELGKYRLVAGDARVEFEVTESSEFGFPYKIALLENGLYVAVRSFGCDAEGLSIDFEALQYRENNGKSFLIEWTNDTAQAHTIGPEFKVYRHNGREYIHLENKVEWEPGAIEVEADLVLSYSYMVTDHYDIAEAGRYRFECAGAWVEFDVTTLYELYTGFDASNGLDVYVWQMGQGGFDFAVAPHGVEETIGSLIFGMPGVNAAQMRDILAAYNIDEEKIHIIPYHNLVSSYIGDYWMHWTAIEDDTPYQNMYMAIIRDMILGDNLRNNYPNVYEKAWIDIDGDGDKEFHQVCHGLVDGEFMFSYVVSEDGKTADYFDTFYTEPMSLKFFTDSDGMTRLRGVREDGSVLIYDISIKNGHVELTELD